MAERTPGRAERRIVGNKLWNSSKAQKEVGHEGFPNLPHPFEFPSRTKDQPVLKEEGRRFSNQSFYWSYVRKLVE